ncbi:hypothetical protein BGW80DRAFT_1352008 [Lactifluus volemus]|nr:hypothetical protein BGW80DRAFT_1352008 [Lactifluus volemus]
MSAPSPTRHPPRNPSSLSRILTPTDSPDAHHARLGDLSTRRVDIHPRVGRTRAHPRLRTFVGRSFTPFLLLRSGR